MGRARCATQLSDALSFSEISVSLLHESLHRCWWNYGLMKTKQLTNRSSLTYSRESFVSDCLLHRYIESELCKLHDDVCRDDRLLTGPEENVRKAGRCSRGQNEALGDLAWSFRVVSLAARYNFSVKWDDRLFHRIKGYTSMIIRKGSTKRISSERFCFERELVRFEKS